MPGDKVLEIDEKKKAEEPAADRELELEQEPAVGMQQELRQAPVEDREQELRQAPVMDMELEQARIVNKEDVNIREYKEMLAANVNNPNRLEILHEAYESRARRKEEEEKNSIKQERQKEDMVVAEKRRREDLLRSLKSITEEIYRLSNQLSVMEHSMTFLKKPATRAKAKNMIGILRVRLAIMKEDRIALIDDKLWGDQRDRIKVEEFEEEKKKRKEQEELKLQREQNFMQQENLENWQKDRQEAIPAELAKNIVTAYIRDWLTGSYDFTGKNFNVLMGTRKRSLFTKLNRKHDMFQALQDSGKENLYKDFFLSYIKQENDTELDFSQFTKEVRLFEKMSDVQMQAYIRSYLSEERNIRASEKEKIVAKVLGRKAFLRTDVRKFLTKVITLRFAGDPNQQEQYMDERGFVFEDEREGNLEAIEINEDLSANNRMNIWQEWQEEMLLEYNEQLLGAEEGEELASEHDRIEKKFCQNATKQVYLAILDQRITVEQASNLLGEDGNYKMPSDVQIENLRQKLDEPILEEFMDKVEEAEENPADLADVRAKMTEAVANALVRAKAKQTRDILSGYLDENGSYLFEEEIREKREREDKEEQERIWETNRVELVTLFREWFNELLEKERNDPENKEYREEIRRKIQKRIVDAIKEKKIEKAVGEVLLNESGNYLFEDEEENLEEEDYLLAD